MIFPYKTEEERLSIGEVGPSASPLSTGTGTVDMLTDRPFHVSVGNPPFQILGFGRI